VVGKSFRREVGHEGSRSQSTVLPNRSHSLGSVTG